MPTEKIGDLPLQMTCQDPDHLPKKANLTPGHYLHRCKNCDREEKFTIWPEGTRLTEKYRVLSDACLSTK